MTPSAIEFLSMAASEVKNKQPTKKEVRVSRVMAFVKKRVSCLTNRQVQIDEYANLHPQGGQTSFEQKPELGIRGYLGHCGSTPS